MTKNAAVEADFDLDDLTATDVSELVIKRRDGTPTSWKWTIAGPGHPATIAQTNRIAREMMARERAQEVARVNGRKWKGDGDETPEELLHRRVGQIVDRVLGWTPVKLNGADYPFSRENAIAILIDPSRGDTLLQQLADFIADDRSFTKRSEKA